MAQHSVLVKDLLKHQWLVTLSVKDSINKALEKLSVNKITSAPVVDENERIYGFLDVMDLLTFMVNQVTQPTNTPRLSTSRSLTMEDMDSLTKRSAQFEVSSLLDVVDSVQHCEPYYPLEETQPLKVAIEIFLKGVHRIAVTDSQKKLVGLLTQTNVIRYLNQDPTLMGFKGTEEIDKMNMLQRHVVSISPSFLTIDAFRTMQEKRLSSLGVVDSNGVLVSILSVSDLKGLKDFHFRSLLLPVIDFLAEVRKDQKKPIDYVVSCGMNSTLKQVIHIMLKEQVHRVFIIDENRRPLGVVSQSDIIREVFGNVSA